MRRSLATALAVLLLLAGACSDDDSASGDPADTTADSSGPTIRFCDAFLEYLADPTPANLDTVEASADDPDVTQYVEIIRTDDRTGRVLAADSDLHDLARERCQSEWIAGTQGAGDTASAAQAFLDALEAGDEMGARNVASANAIAVFAPWDPIEPDPQLGTPSLVGADEDTFTLALDADRLAECQVETGVIIACTLAE